LPSELTSPAGKPIDTQALYRVIEAKYRREFEEFVYERLKIPREATSLEVAESIRAFWAQAEKELDRSLLQGDLSSMEGCKRVVKAIFASFPHQDTFALKPEVSLRNLKQFPPANLLIKLAKLLLLSLKRNTSQMTY